MLHLVSEMRLLYSRPVLQFSNIRMAMSEQQAADETPAGYEQSEGGELPSKPHLGARVGVVMLVAAAFLAGLAVGTPDPKNISAPAAVRLDRLAATVTQRDLVVQLTGSKADIDKCLKEVENYNHTASRYSARSLREAGVVQHIDLADGYCSAPPADKPKPSTIPGVKGGAPA
jgi:hypothetical protein